MAKRVAPTARFLQVLAAAWGRRHNDLVGLLEGYYSGESVITSLNLLENMALVMGALGRLAEVEEVCQLLRQAAAEAQTLFDASGTQDYFGAGAPVPQRVSPTGSFLEIIAAAWQRDAQSVSGYLEQTDTPFPGVNLLDEVPNIISMLQGEAGVDEVCAAFTTAAAEAQELDKSTGTAEMFSGAFVEGSHPDEILASDEPDRSFNGPTDGRVEIAVEPEGKSGDDFKLVSAEDQSGDDFELVAGDIGLAESDEPSGAEDVTAVDPASSGINLSRPSDSGIDLRNVPLGLVTGDDAGVGDDEIELTLGGAGSVPSSQQVRADFPDSEAADGEIRLPEGFELAEGDERDAPKPDA